MELIKCSLETIGMAWLRFHRGCHVVATESGWPLNGDVVGYDGKFIYEIEVKRTWSDFKADFKKAKKHENMRASKGMANYFYYLVEDKIASKVEEFLKENYPKYGLLVSSHNFQQYCDSVLKVRRIHERSPHPKRVRDLCNRLSSELLNLRLCTESINQAIHNLSEEVKSSINTEVKEEDLAADVIDDNCNKEEREDLQLGSPSPNT